MKAKIVGYNSLFRSNFFLNIITDFNSFNHLKFIFIKYVDFGCWEVMQQNPRLCNSQHSYHNGFPRFDDTSVELFFIWENRPTLERSFYIILIVFFYTTGVSFKVIFVVKKIDKYVEIFMNHPDIDKKYNENDLKKKLNISNEGGICDGYCHHYKCNNYLLEGKTASHITKAINQLKNTAEQLIKKGHKIDKAIIFCKKIPRSEKKLYRQNKDNTLCKRDSIYSFKLFGNIDIYICYWKNISEVGISWLFG